MAQRPHKSLIDYLVIAISPALIMLMVGSLVFFLIEVFYQGNFHGRLQYIFALFVFAAVLVGRISIEEGRERAILFALPLTVCTLAVISQFVEFQGGILTQLSFFINCTIIALILWSADRLTWDCTMIDDSELDSGEGLLEAVGIDRPDLTSIQQEIQPRVKEPEGDNPIPASRDLRQSTDEKGQSPRSWWKRYVERRRRPHTPGVWVFYFSLAALPLFGLGQIFLSSGNLAARQYSFVLLVVYTASGLGLLLATSFLGLRRYLRQRRQEMPLMMVNLWLSTGAALIVGVMLAAMFLPRPNAEYTISQFPFRVGSPDQDSSSYGMGPDGVEEDQAETLVGQPDSTASETVQSENVEQPSSGEENRSAGSDQSGGESQSEGQGSPNQQGQSPSEQEKGSGQSKQNIEPGGRDQGKNAKATSGNSNSAGKKFSAGKRSLGGSRESGGSSYRPSMPRTLPIPKLSWLPTLLKWIFYGTLLWLTWRYRRELLMLWQNTWQQLLDLWYNLFNGRSSREKVAGEPAVSMVVPRRFADFTDPFAAGIADRYPPEELVRYTFEALEAWANDQGYPRLPEQTPYEFTQSLALRVAALSDATRRLADMYCRVAYAHATVSSSQVKRLSHLWQELRNPSAPPIIKENVPS